MTDAPPPPDADLDLESTPPTRWSRRHQAIVWGGIAAGALVIAGITGAVIAAALPQAPAVAGYSDEPQAEPTPSDARGEFEVVEPPRPVLDVTCSGLISDAVAASLFQLEDVRPRDVVDDPPGSLTSAMYRQAGASYCRWGGDYRTDAGYDTGVDLVVLPDGADYYFAHIRPEALIDVNYTVVDSQGDASTYRCSVYGSYWCNADMVVGDYWVHVVISSALSTEASEDEANAVARRVLAEVEGGINRADSALAPWAGPADPYDGETLCALTPERASEIAGVPGLQSSDDWHGYYASIDTAVGERLGYRSCGWVTPDSYYFTVGSLPGGAWSTSAMTDPDGWGSSWWKHIEVAGADDALIGCSSAWCNGYLAVEGSLVTVYSDSGDAATFGIVLTRLVAAL